MTLLRMIFQRLPPPVLSVMELNMGAWRTQARFSPCPSTVEPSSYTSSMHAHSLTGAPNACADPVHCDTPGSR